MTENEQVEQVIKLLEESNPEEFFKKFDEIRTGIGAAICQLSKNGGLATAGQLSESMGVSSARVAVLIRKMTAKGIVSRSADEKDARVTIVRLTEKGQLLAEEGKRNMYRDVQTLIEKVGMEKIMEFIEISNIIRSVFRPHDENCGLVGKGEEI